MFFLIWDWKLSSKSSYNLFQATCFTLSEYTNQVKQMIYLYDTNLNLVSNTPLQRGADLDFTKHFFLLLLLLQTWTSAVSLLALGCCIYRKCQNWPERLSRILFPFKWTSTQYRSSQWRRYCCLKNAVLYEEVVYYMFVKVVCISCMFLHGQLAIQYKYKPGMTYLV